MKFPQIGELLPNGHIVDAAYCVGEDRYVLAHRDGAPEPYVVWSVDQDGDTRNGRYFTDPVRAQRCFAKRCFDWTDNPQAPQKNTNAFAETDRYTVIKIVYGDPDMQNLRVFINEDEIKDLKEFSIVARDGEFPNYRCERLLPIPGKYAIHCGAPSCKASEGALPQRPKAIEKIAVPIKTDEFYDMFIHPRKIHDALKRIEKDLVDTD